MGAAVPARLRALASTPRSASQGIWWAFPITNVTIALITLCVFAKGDWKKKRLLDEEEVLTTKVSDDILSGEQRR